MLEIKDAVLMLLRNDYVDEYRAAFAEKTAGIPAEAAVEDEKACMEFLHQAGLREEYLL